jgi:sugar/nucleoside kinase (ribokinase family)
MLRPQSSKEALMKSLHFGSAMIDVICIVAAENIERMSFTNEGKSFLMIETGRKVPARSITTHVGGGACNTAVCLARRNWQAAVLAKTGAGLNADAVRDHLRENGVATDRMISAPDLSTGTSLLLATQDRNFSIFVHRGANEAMTAEELPEGAFKDMDLVYVAALSGASTDRFGDILAGARAAGAMVAVNPGMRQITGRTERLVEALAGIDLLSVNRAEAEALMPGLAPWSPPEEPVPPDAPELMRRGLSFGGFHMGLLGFLAAVRAAGPRWAVVTDSTDGAYLASPEGVFWHPAIPVTPQGTAGAGDAYCSTLTAALVEGVAPEQAMLEAALNSAAVVGAIDTTSGLLTPDQMAERRAEAGDVVPKRF